VPPKAWRWTGRSRSPVEYHDQSRPDLLLELAAEQATGALYLNGRWGGTIFLVHGRIGQVESLLTPGIEALLLRPTYPDESRWAELVPGLRRGETEAATAAATRLLRRPSTSPVDVEILRRTALADAALAALGPAVPDTARTRSRFRPGEKHWWATAPTFTVAAVLAEVHRRQEVLARMTLGVQPERPVRRVPKLPLERMRLTATQWNIARSADGINTPLDLAWLLGHGVFATTVAVHQLARLGVLTVDPDLPASHPLGLVPARHVTSFLRAAQPGPGPEQPALNGSEERGFA
jgi:hypothetical protein